jgi:rubrerythrin
MPDEQDKALEALQTALKMEIDGREFYLNASKRSNNKLGKELLKKLAAEEDLHRDVFQDIYNTIKSQKGWPDDEKFRTDGGRGLRTVFARALEAMDNDIKSIPTELDAIQTAMDMENKTLDFYNSRGSQAAYDAERRLYEELAIQEGEHFRVLLDYFEFLKNPAAWFVQKEHHSLDGS